MQPFEFPDFYMPYPARLNPHLEGARAHCKAWALRMGMLGSEQGSEGGALWSEGRFDAMDFAHFTALTHPDVPAPELDLLSDWYVWGWFVDDYCSRRFEQGNDATGAREYVSRVLEFLPEDLGAPTPAPANPVEHALVDLWPRTAPTMSPAWRRRYAGTLRRLADAYLKDIQGAGRERVLDPIEYVGLRREVSGLFWSSDLVEHSLGVDIPAPIYDSRPVRVLRDVFADVVGLRNDVISYNIDVAEGRVNNAVMVMAHFLGCDLQRAAEVVNDLVTSRLYQFENTVATELPALFEERLVDPLSRLTVLRFAKALQDWMAGDLEWELRPGGRYVAAPPEGTKAQRGQRLLGAAAARVGLSRSAAGLRYRTYSFIPYRSVPPFPLPDVYMPFAAPRVSPHVESVRARSKAWARRVGMFSTIPGDSAWDEEAFDAPDLGLLCSMLYPDGDELELESTTCWYAWMTHMDDYLMMMFAHRRDLAGAKGFAARLLSFMTLDPAMPSPAPINAPERALLDLWSRTAPTLSVRQRREVRAALEEGLESHLLEIADRQLNRVPDPIDYMEMRRRSFSIDLALTMDPMAPDAEVRRHRPVREMESCSVNVVCLLNDIYSYGKEIEVEGQAYNGVLVVQHFLGCDLAEAVAWVNRLMAARVRRFEHIVATELPVIERDLDPQQVESLRRWAKTLERWMSASAATQPGSRRNHKDEARKLSPLYRLSSTGPKGLGTSAARLFTLLAEERAPTTSPASSSPDSQSLV